MKLGLYTIQPAIHLDFFTLYEKIDQIRSEYGKPNFINIVCENFDNSFIHLLSEDIFHDYGQNEWEKGYYKVLFKGKIGYIHIERLGKFVEDK